jgi:hypothetical protein
MSLQTMQPSQPTWVERRAKLFEAGEYPDKGVTVTEAHLALLAGSFSDPVPVLIEHAHSPLEMGYLTAVFQEGSELFGTVALTPEANALAARSGASALSLGLAPDLSSIREVSLVRNPRIADARLFGGEVVFEGKLVDGRPPTPQATIHEQWSALRSAQVDQEVANFTRAGKLCPAQTEFARALLLSEDTIEFGGRGTPVRQLVLSLIDTQPSRNFFSELAPSPRADHSRHLMLPEEAEFYRRHFPDVSLDEIARTR